MTDQSTLATPASQSNSAPSPTTMPGGSASDASPTGASPTRIKTEAGRLGSKAVDRVAGAVDRRKGEVAEPIRQVSTAIDAAAAKLEDDAAMPAWVGDALRQAASAVSGFAARIDTTDSRALYRDVEQFARQRPALFLGGCALIGFAAARVLRAGGTGGSAQGQGSSGSDISGNSGMASTDVAAQPMGAGSLS